MATLSGSPKINRSGFDWGYFILEGIHLIQPVFFFSVLMGTLELDGRHFGSRNENNWSKNWVYSTESDIWWSSGETSLLHEKDRHFYNFPHLLFELPVYIRWQSIFIKDCGSHRGCAKGVFGNFPRWSSMVSHMSVQSIQANGYFPWLNSILMNLSPNYFANIICWRILGYQKIILDRFLCHFAKTCWLNILSTCHVCSGRILLHLAI